MQSKQVQFISG